VRVKPCGTEGGLCVARTVELALVSVMWRGCVVRDTRAHFPRPAESPNANDNVANAVANRSTSDGGKGDRRVRHDRACLINRLTTTDHLLRTNGCAEAKYSRCSAAPIGDGRDS